MEVLSGANQDERENAAYKQIEKTKWSMCHEITYITGCLTQKSFRFKQKTLKKKMKVFALFNETNFWHFQ